MSTVKDIVLPDIGGVESVELVEWLVSVGDNIVAEQPLCNIESSKTSMELPADCAGELVELLVTAGSTITIGTVIARIKAEEKTQQPVTSAAEPTTAATISTQPAVITVEPLGAPIKPQTTGIVYSSPAVRYLAREWGVNLSEVSGTGRKGRTLKHDVQRYVRQRLQQGKSIPNLAEIDFEKFGEKTTQPLSKLQKLSAQNLYASWLNIPHVTHFDKADVEGMMEERARLNNSQTIKITPLIFAIKAVAITLTQFPTFNASLAATGEAMIVKQYINIGVAVDTDIGLLVPVIKNVDKKNIFQVAKELASLAESARHKKLKPADMQGASFTISSLGHIGGEAFTPIINPPEVAILGLSKIEVLPVWNGTNFEPRQTLPLSLSYDHRVIDGVTAAKFCRQLAANLADINALTVR